MVPKVTAKLGAQYDWVISEHALSVDIGYSWINYLNAITSFTGNGIVFANVGNPSTANFNLNGLYVGLRLIGNA